MWAGHFARAIVAPNAPAPWPPAGSGGRVPAKCRVSYIPATAANWHAAAGTMPQRRLATLRVTQVTTPSPRGLACVAGLGHPSRDPGTCRVKQPGPDTPCQVPDFLHSGDSRKLYSSGTPPLGPCRNGDLQFTGDTGVLPLHRVDSLALLGSGIRAVILEPAGSNNQNQTPQPNDVLFHPPLQGLEILTMS